MTDNMKILIDQVTTAINSEYGDSLPTLEQINDKADTFRTLFAPLYPISDEEYIRVKRELATNIFINYFVPKMFVFDVCNSIKQIL